MTQLVDPATVFVGLITALVIAGRRDDQTGLYARRVLALIFGGRGA
ncbi:hypothetical protein ACIF6L_26725 [Kitasatospora sp. NPDC086009]